jgi:hypothetical protein
MALRHGLRELDGELERLALEAGNETMVDSKTSRKRLEIFLVVTITGLGTGLLAALPQERWSAAWGNSFGAAIVAVGGLIGCLREAKAIPESAVTWSWACVVVVGFVIAGASLQMALAP